MIALFPLKRKRIQDLRLNAGSHAKTAGRVFPKLLVTFVKQNFVFRYKQSRFNARRIRKRVVFKHGDCNVVQANVAKRRRKYLQDIFTTLVDAQWRWTLLVFAFNFLGSWLVFAVVWWLIAYTHGDLLEEHIVSQLAHFS